MGEKVKEKAWILFGAGDEGKYMHFVIMTNAK